MTEVAVFLFGFALMVGVVALPWIVARHREGRRV